MLPKIHILNSILILLQKKKIYIYITLIINFINTIQKKLSFSIFHFCYIKLLSFTCSKAHFVIHVCVYMYNVYVYAFPTYIMFMFIFSMFIGCELNCPNYKCSIIFFFNLAGPLVEFYLQIFICYKKKHITSWRGHGPLQIYHLLVSLTNK